MKQKYKYIILSLLFILLIYIWWGNINQFTSTETYYNINSLDKKIDSKKPNQELSNTFNAPKINPFKKPNYGVTVNSKNKNVQSKKEEKVPKLSNKYLLKGFIWDNEQPQVIIKQNTNTFILSLKDSLELWELISLTDSSVIFRHDKEKDTLLLSL